MFKTYKDQWVNLNIEQIHKCNLDTYVSGYYKFKS